MTTSWSTGDEADAAVSSVAGSLSVSPIGETRRGRATTGSSAVRVAGWLRGTLFAMSPHGCETVGERHRASTASTSNEWIRPEVVDA